VSPDFLRGLAPLLALLLVACTPEEEPDLGPYPDWCRHQTFDGTLTDATAGELNGRYIGVYNLPVGTLLTMKVIPEHPFQVTGIRVSPAGSAGPIRVRLTESIGRSYPNLQANLVAPIEVEVADPDPDEWLEFDVSDEEVFLEPTQHYILAFELLPGGPTLGVENIPEGERNRALVHAPGEQYAWGSQGHFRMELAGQTFCEMDAEYRWFEEATDPPWGEGVSQRAAIADLNGDGHDDLVLNGGGPFAYLGDGAGGFADPGFDPFPDTPRASNLVFADVDNDGDVDAFAAHHVAADGDGDGTWRTFGDCDDTDAAVNPNADEVDDNGRDDDCDGTADDGTDTTDVDEDGAAISDGDCDDDRDDVYPEAPELLDGRDNDCDGSTDEDFANRILLNDGTGHFTALADAGVEVLDPTPAAAFGDADGDGLLDLYWGNWLVTYPHNPSVQDRFFAGTGGGVFEDAQQAAGLVRGTPYSCYGVNWADYNNDGAPDIYVGNYHAFPNQLWENDGSGSFTDVAEDVGVAEDDEGSPFSWALSAGQTFGGDFGDVDNDGDLDLYVANLSHPRDRPDTDISMLLLNQGAPDYTFTDVTAEYGFVYDEGDVNAAFADFDNDMDLDLVVASIYPNHYARLYRNDGEDGFFDVTYETGTAVHEAVSAVWSDVDEDGDLDLVIADREGPHYVHLFINQVGQVNSWVEIDLEGATTNRDAIGARVTLEAGGITQIREVKGGGGHENTQSSRRVHFGLGRVPGIDSVTVRWVGGAEEEITGLEPNGRYRVVEGSGRGVPAGR
jgi:hypothetical protein